MAIDYLRLTDKSYISFLHPRLLSADNFVFTIHIERRITKWHCSTAGIYLLKVIIGNTVTMFEICSKLALKTSEQGHLRRSGVFIVNFTEISHSLFHMKITVSVTRSLASR